jgi:hypothetical protein
MIDRPRNDTTFFDAEDLADNGASRRSTRRSVQRRRSHGRARVAVAGIGFTAMLALVGSMELAEGHTESAAAARPSKSTAPRTVVVVHKGAAPASIVAVVGATSRPIVLTAHPKVRVVTVGGGAGTSSGYSSGSGSGSGYVASSSGGSTYHASAPAAAPAAAPVASTSGSAAH